MDERLLCVCRAKLAEFAERYDDMTTAMNKVVNHNPKLNGEERNLLSVAYKNMLGGIRTSLRRCLPDETGDAVRNECVTKYRRKLEEEVEDVCSKAIDLLENHLQPNNLDLEEKVFYLKMRGDYHRYIAESSEKEKRQQAADNSRAAYEAAMKEATKDPGGLASTNPVRLGLALNYSVFHYEIANNPVAACQIAKTSFDLALLELENLSEENYKDSALIMQLLRDNLTLWTSEPDGEDDAKDGQGEKA